MSFAKGRLLNCMYKLYTNIYLANIAINFCLAYRLFNVAVIVSAMCKHIACHAMWQIAEFLHHQGKKLY